MNGWMSLFRTGVTAHVLCIFINTLHPLPFEFPVSTRKAAGTRARLQKLTGFSLLGFCFHVGMQFTHFLNMLEDPAELLLHSSSSVPN